MRSKKIITVDMLEKAGII